jgi:hypothetical protein
LAGKLGFARFCFEMSEGTFCGFSGNFTNLDFIIDGVL